jgi:poly(ADP-ribose) glycohydrolase ARH3
VNLVVDDLKDRFAGSLLGLALGDALGAPFEGSSPGMRRYRCEGYMIYTDDTEMALNLAESIIARGDVLSEDIAASFVRGMNQWRGYGPGTLRVLSLIRSGMHFKEAAGMVFPDGSFGNGAAMRIAPVGLLYWWDRRRLSEATLKACIPTHVHPLAVEGALIISYTISLILKGTPKRDIPDRLAQIVKEPIYVRKIKVLRMLISDRAGSDEVIRRLGNNVFAQNSVLTAVYAFLGYGDNFRDLVDFCISIGGDTDTIGAMAGALYGAYAGVGGLPAECLHRLEGAGRIMQVAGELFTLSEGMRRDLPS